MKVKELLSLVEEIDIQKILKDLYTIIKRRKSDIAADRYHDYFPKVKTKDELLKAIDKYTQEINGMADELYSRGDEEDAERVINVHNDVLNYKKDIKAIPETNEMIRKMPDKNVWTLKSKKSGRNLGTFKSKKAAVKHEKQIQYFKHIGESLITMKELFEKIGETPKSFYTAPTVKMEDGKDKCVIVAHEGEGMVFISTLILEKLNDYNLGIKDLNFPYGVGKLSDVVPKDGYIYYNIDTKRIITNE